MKILQLLKNRFLNLWVYIYRRKRDATGDRKECDMLKQS